MRKISANTLSDWMAMETRLMLVIFAALAVAPVFIKNPYLMHILIVSVLYAFIAQCWNIVGGIAGQLSIGHIMYFGIGAYTSIILFAQFDVSPWIGMLAGGVAGGILAIFVSFLGLRYGLSGDYYALFTLAMSQMIRLIITNIKFLGGAMGIYVPLKGFGLVNMQFQSKEEFFYLALFFLIVVTVLTKQILASRMGMYFIALRENESAAEALGIDTVKYKTLATVIGGGLTAMGGTIFAMYTTYIDPILMLGLDANFEFILMAIIGGKGTMLGPVVGALALKPMAEIVRAIFGSGKPGLFLMIYGALLSVTILFMPNGLMGVIRKVYIRLTAPKINDTSEEGEKIVIAPRS